MRDIEIRAENVGVLEADIGSAVHVYWLSVTIFREVDFAFFCAKERRPSLGFTKKSHQEGAW